MFFFSWFPFVPLSYRPQDIPYSGASIAVLHDSFSRSLVHYILLNPNNVVFAYLQPIASLDPVRRRCQ